MNLVDYMEPERVAAEVWSTFDRYEYPLLEEGDIRHIVQLMERIGIKFYRDLGEL